jgi:hypothetical protein
MLPDANALTQTVQKWKASVDQIRDIEGLNPTFVLNVMPANAHRPARANGVGNVWGLENERRNFISKYFSSSMENMTCTAWHS